MNGVTAAYSLIEPNGTTCMLIRGVPDTANLKESWFAAINDDADDYGPSYDEAHEPH
jgi:hypothetical protein